MSTLADVVGVVYEVASSSSVTDPIARLLPSGHECVQSIEYAAKLSYLSCSCSGIWRQDCLVDCAVRICGLRSLAATGYSGCKVETRTATWQSP
jgi:hypothetical protein